MDQVVRDVDAGAGAAQRVGLGDIALVELAALIGQLARAVAVAHEAAHLDPVRHEPAGQSPADETGRACDERFQSVGTAA